MNNCESILGIKQWSTECDFFFASNFLQTLNKMNEIAIKVKNKILKKGWHPENSVENEYLKLFNYLKKSSFEKLA